MKTVNGVFINMHFFVLEALRDVIRDKVRRSRPLLQPSPEGSYILYPPKAQDLSTCSEIIIFNDNEDVQATTVSCWDKILQTVTTADPMLRNWEIGDTVERTFDGQRLDIYLGSPPDIPRFPACTTEITGLEQTSLTLGLINDKIFITVKVFYEMSDYDRNYRSFAFLVQAIENGLYRTQHPLTQPYATTTLNQQALPGDFIISLADNTIFGMPTVFDGNNNPMLILENDARRTYHFVKTIDTGGNVVELRLPVSYRFDVGTKVIRPLVHTWDFHLERIDYYDAKSDETLLKVAEMLYVINMARTQSRI